MALSTAQQAERSFWSKQQLSIFWVPAIHVQPPGRRIVSFPGKNCNPAGTFYFSFIYLKSLHPDLCPVCEMRSQLQSHILQGWTLCAAREEHDHGQWLDLLLVLQEARSYSSAAQSQALFPPSSSSSPPSTAATEETRTRWTAVSVSCQIHFTFCHGLFLQLSVQLSRRFSGWWTEIYLPDLELRNN